MSHTVYTIALAGLLHDIGKFMQRAEVPLSAASMGMENSICKPNKKGYYDYRHALYTNEFFEHFALHPHLGTSLEQDSIANLAAYHHSPNSKMKELIHLADRLSSGSDRQEDEDCHSDRERYKKARMHVIFDYLSLGDKKNDSAAFRYELDPLDGDAENCFPTHINNLSPKEGEKIVKGYGELWDAFREELEGVETEGIEGFTIALLSLLEKYTWCIPSSTMDRPDISLFDHAKTTAAIAAALYTYHTESGDLSSAPLFVNDEAQKFRLLVGDLSGIQKYIFDIRNVGVGGTAKRLRARSFYLSVLAEVASHALLHRFGLPLANLLMASGGKFYLLLPNTADSEKSIAAFDHELSEWLMKNLNGEIALNIASVPFSCKELLEFDGILKRANDALQSVKEQAFASILAGGNGWKEEAFILERQFTDDDHLCPSCRKFPGEKQAEEGIVLCSHCSDDAKLGRELAKAVGVQFFKGNKAGYRLFGGYSFKIVQKREEFSLDAYMVHQFNNWDFGPTDVALKPRPFANYVPRFDHYLCRGNAEKCDCPEKENAQEGNPKFFNCLAEAGKGRAALGVFKADVDSLGLIFINGFGKVKNKSDKCISRITTLSRLLETFFTGRLDYLLREEFKDIYTVYAGGDDLLMLGPWEQVLRFSKRVRDEFAEFTCGNPAFTLSAGVALAKPRLPVYAAVQAAEGLLKQAKENKADGNREPKNQLAALGDLVKWDEIEEIQKEADRLASWQEAKKVSTGFVLQLLDSARQFEEYSKTGETRHLRFVPMLAYAITRNISPQETELIAWAQELTDLKSKKLKNLNYIANYSINMNRS